MQKTIHTKQYRILISSLRDFREKQELTQTDLGKILGVDQTFISKVETAERRLDVIELRSFCQALGISLLDFITHLESQIEKNA